MINIKGFKNTSTTNKLFFAKVKSNAIVPTKRDEDAGYDLYPCFDGDIMIIPALTTKLVPTGIACAMDKSKYMQIQERGSTGSKGIKYSAGVIDSGFRGEIMICITNCNTKDLVISKLEGEDLFNEEGNASLTINNKTVKVNKDDLIIYPYTKGIAQGIIHEVHEMDCEEITYDELKNIESERGVGLLGSTNK